MKFPNYETPGKVRAGENHPVKLLVILGVIILGMVMVNLVREQLPQAVDKFKSSQEQEQKQDEHQQQLEAERQRVLKKRRKAEQKSAPIPASTPQQDNVIAAIESHVAPVIKPGEVTLSIRNHGFTPVEFVGPGLHASLNIKLYKKQFTEVKKEPKYKGYAQWFGYMDLGNQQNRRFHFVLDLQNDETFRLYFDANKNNDLTDDGSPIKNTGSGTGGFDGFACMLKVPWQYLIEATPFKGDFNIWFFMNEAGWSKDQKASHYSRTQLETILNLEGKEYRALLVDTGYNDADLTNDGIIIDANRSGDFDPGERPASEFVLDGKSYKFNIIW